MSAGVWLLVGLIGCKGGGDTEVPADSDTDAGGDSDVTEGGFPADPTPFDVTFGGAISATLPFSAPTCTVTANNFRMMWRGEGHEVVIIAETLGQYAGPGTYDLSMPNTRAKFQEEAYGAGYGYFVTDAAQGDSFTLTVDGVDPETANPRRAWGHFEVASMHGDSGALTLSPSTFPVWCPEVN